MLSTRVPATRALLPRNRGLHRSRMSTNVILQGIHLPRRKKGYVNPVLCLGTKPAAAAATTIPRQHQRQVPRLPLGCPFLHTPKIGGVYPSLE
jgi:hypothetical protein